MTIRTMTVDDIADVLPLIEDFQQFLDNDSFSGEKATQIMLRMMMTPEMTFQKLAVNEDDKPVGFFFGYAQPGLFDGTFIAYEMGMYVDPEHRNKHHGLDLFNEFLWWAKELGVSRIIVGGIYSVKSEGLAKVLERRGFKPAGQWFTGDFDSPEGES